MRMKSRNNELLSESFAVTCEAIRLTSGIDVDNRQLYAGLGVADGHIVQMEPGSGRTLAMTLAAFFHALEGKGVHVMTINDALAARDATTYEKIAELRGGTVGRIYPGQALAAKQAAYQAHITVGSLREFIFDYLRDARAMELSQQVRGDRGGWALVDDADVNMIDREFTRYVLTEPTTEVLGQTDAADLAWAAAVSPGLQPGVDFTAERHGASLTETGVAKIAEPEHVRADLPAGANAHLRHRVDQALTAHWLLVPDVDYIVLDDEVLIVEHTGRCLEGGGWSAGLHQALEAKECCPIRPPRQIVAAITTWDYLRSYPGLAGLTIPGPLSDTVRSLGLREIILTANQRD